MAFQLASAFVELNQRGFSGVMGHIDKIKTGMGGIVSFATGPLGVALAGLGAGAGAAGLVSLAAKIEQTTTQFKTLLGSTDMAKRMIEDLQNFSASTPFQFDGLAESAKVLLAFGTSSEQVIPTMRVLGDVAAATGNQVGELANIYGKVKARGALMTESLDQFNERAIPVGAKLAEMFGKTESEIRDMASKGQISFGDLQRAMSSMTAEGGMAFNGMADQSQTLGGLWSTLKDNVTLVMTDIGNAIVEGFDLKNSTESITGFVQQVRSEWMPSIVNSFRWMSDNIVKPFSSAIGYITELMVDLIGNFDLYWEYAYTSLGNSINNMWQRVSTFFENAVTLGGWFVSNIGNFFVNMYNNAGRIFGNMVQMMKNYWSGLWEFFTTGRLNIDFSPIVDNFNAAMEGIKMPELKTPQLNALQTDLDRISNQLAARQEARRKRAEEASASANDNAIAALEIQADGEEKVTEEKKKQKDLSSSFVSLSQLAEKMQTSLSFGQGGQQAIDQMQPAGDVAAGGMNGRDTIAALQQQVTALTGLLDLARGSGLKIASSPGGVDLPSASVQFGGSPA